MKKIRRFEPQILGQPKSKLMALQYPVTKKGRIWSYWGAKNIEINIEEGFQGRGISEAL